MCHRQPNATASLIFSPELFVQVSSFSIVTRLQAGRPGLDSAHGYGIFFFTASIQALGSTHPPIQWAPGVISLGIKRRGREADHSLPSAEVKNA